jgi:hypothetical protein
MYVPQACAPKSADTLPHRNVRFRPVAVYASWERDAVQALALTETELEEYFRIREVAFGGKPPHQVSGFPTPVQGDSMELECELASHGVYCGDAKGYESKEAAALKGGVADWRLLFQIAADDDYGAMWGDAGNIYFWVQERDARAVRFEDVWLGSTRVFFDPCPARCARDRSVGRGGRRGGERVQSARSRLGVPEPAYR